MVGTADTEKLHCGSLVDIALRLSRVANDFLLLASISECILSLWFRVSPLILEGGNIMEQTRQGHPKIVEITFGLLLLRLHMAKPSYRFFSFSSQLGPISDFYSSHTVKKPHAMKGDNEKGFQ